MQKSTCYSKERIKMSKAIESELLRYSCLLRDEYATLNRIIGQMESDGSPSVEPIREQMQKIKDTESELAPIREAYMKSRDHASADIQAVTDETIELVKSLMPKLANMEKASVESLRRLFPKIQGSVRAVQMQNAYGSQGSR